MGTSKNSVWPVISDDEFRKAYIDIHIPFTNEEVGVIPKLREFIGVTIFYAIRGSEYNIGLADRVIPQFRDDILIPYYRKFIRKIKILYLMERVLEKQFWNLKIRHKSLKDIDVINIIVNDMYVYAMAALPDHYDYYNIDDIVGPLHSVLDVQYSPLHPFPNINIKKWIKTPDVIQRRDKLRRYYELAGEWNKRSAWTVKTVRIFDP